MKRVIRASIVMVFLLALIPGASLAHTEDDPFAADLIAGQHMNVGDVEVWNDADTLHIKYVIADPDWCIMETHLQVVENVDSEPVPIDGVPDGIPHKNGNPIPGKFEENDDHDCVSDVLYTYNLDDKGWDVYTELAIAAHAVVRYLGSGAADPYADELVEFNRIDGIQYDTSGDNGDDGSDVLGEPAIDPNTPATCTIASGDPNGCWTSPGYIPGDYDEVSETFLPDSLGQLDDDFCNANPIDPERCPQAGHLTVKFNNICEFSPDSAQPSLFVWEVGGKTEGFFVEVFSGDTKLDEFASTPTTQTNGDVPIFFGQTTGTFDTVTLTSTDNGGGDPLAPNTSGPDIDAVECLNLVFEDETAWGAGFDLPGKNWATYFTYEVQEVWECHEAELAVGWDIFNDPINSGDVTWCVEAFSGTLSADYMLDGALANHTYTVGVHLFDQSDPGQDPIPSTPPGDDNAFAGWYVGEGEATRDVVGPAYVEGFDFGYLTTDENGDGTVGFLFESVPSGEYYAQFTVRIGTGCPPTGCSVVYRTGAPYSVNLEVVSIP